MPASCVCIIFDDCWLFWIFFLSIASTAILLFTDSYSSLSLISIRLIFTGGC
eukprot:m.937171 g.937171  ORF g.937171 m.937171 type:complete len:52 (+) comp227246_c0_seq1:201-356(+)